MQQFHKFITRRLQMWPWATFVNVTDCLLVILGVTSNYEDKLGVSLIIIQTRYTKFSDLFWNETLQVLDSFSVHNQEFFHANVYKKLYKNNLVFVTVYLVFQGTVLYVS
jgi:hypothetical protein